MQRPTDRQTEREATKSIQSRDLPEGKFTWVFPNKSELCSVLARVLFPQSTKCVCISLYIPFQKKAGTRRINTCIPFSQTFKIFVIYPRQGNKLSSLYIQVHLPAEDLNICSIDLHIRTGQYYWLRMVRTFWVTMKPSRLNPTKFLVVCLKLRNRKKDSKSEAQINLKHIIIFSVALEMRLAWVCLYTKAVCEVLYWAGL